MLLVRTSAPERDQMARPGSTAPQQDARSPQLILQNTWRKTLRLRFRSTNISPRISSGVDLGSAEGGGGGEVHPYSP